MVTSVNTRPTRRQVLRGGAVAAASVAVGAWSTRAVGAEQSEVVDTIIVGAGYAGAVAALRLAEAGRSCVLLERGRRWDIRPDGDTFARLGNLDGRAVWLSSTLPLSDKRVTPFTGVLDVVNGNGVVCWAGAGVGGGSLVNNTVMMTPPERAFRASLGHLLDYDEMADRWWPRALDLIGASPIPSDVLAADAYANARDLAAEAERAGLGVLRPHLAIDWDVVRAELAGSAVAAVTRGDWLFGANSGAKLSVDRTVLARAEATGRVSVLPLHQVTALRRAAEGYELDVHRLDEHGKVLARPSWRAREVILAAGALGTNQLLVTAKATGALPALSPQTGRMWGTNGDHLVQRAATGAVAAAQGGPAHIAVIDHDNPFGPVTLLGYPLGLPVDGLAGGLAVEDGLAIGRWRYDRFTRQSTLTWPASDPRLRRFTQAAEHTAAALNGATPGSVTLLTSPLATSHSLGGAVLGVVTDGDGQVRGCPGLYVVDGSLLPGTCAAAPPALTVTALADRCMTRILNRAD